MKIKLKILFLILFMSINLVDISYAEQQVKPKHQEFTYFMNSSEGILTMMPRCILRGAPNKIYKKGDKISCYAFWNGNYVEDNKGYKWPVYQWTGNR